MGAISVFIDDKKVFEINETKIKLLKDVLKSEGFEEELVRRLCWGWSQKISDCFSRVIQQWGKTLKERCQSIPTDEDELLELIFSQSDYKNRDERDEQEALKAAEEARIKAAEDEVAVAKAQEATIAAVESALLKKSGAGLYTPISEDTLKAIQEAAKAKALEEAEAEAKAQEAIAATDAAFLKQSPDASIAEPE